MPSVRGRQRTQVIAAMGVTAMSGGGLVGFAVGVLLAPLAFVDSSLAIVVTLALAATADAVWIGIGRPRPLSVNRQVPRQWSSLFSAPITASLYGGRLGIGPLTMLSTWLWWAGTIGSGMLGVVPAVLFGATFALARTLTTVLASVWAEGSSHQQRFSQLRSMQRPGRLVIAATVVGCLVLSACSSPARPELSDQTIPLAPSTTASPLAADELAGTAKSAPTVVVTEPEATRITPVQDDADSSSSEPSPAPTSEPPAETASDPLEAALLEQVPGFTPIDDPIADRSLDIEAAASIQPDPSEERPLLETRGFFGGWTRAFRNDSRDVVVITVYEFRDETEAAFYLEDGLITIGGYGGEFFDIPDIEGGRGFRQEEALADDATEGEAEALTSVGVTFVRGSKWFLVYLVGATETLQPEIVINAATEQATRAS